MHYTTVYYYPFLSCRVLLNFLYICVSYRSYGWHSILSQWGARCRCSYSATRSVQYLQCCTVRAVQYSVVRAMLYNVQYSTVCKTVTALCALWCASALQHDMIEYDQVVWDVRTYVLATSIIIIIDCLALHSIILSYYSSATSVIRCIWIVNTSRFSVSNSFHFLDKNCIVEERTDQ